MTKSNYKEKIIKQNAKAHTKNIKTYKNSHREIYNSIEQERMKNALARIIEKKRDDFLALDYGSGEGNLTKQLLSLGVQVTAADVSDQCLGALKEKYGVDTILLNGRDVDNIRDNTYDFIGLYSVVHHIPDYLYVIDKLIDKLKIGSILYIDHESSAYYWNNYSEVEKFRKGATTLRAKFRKYLRPRNYVNKLRRIFLDPHYAEEGDIHVFMDDHIEWDKMLDIVSKKCDVIAKEDYLLFNGDYKKYEYDRAVAGGLTDTTMMIARRLR